MKKFTKAMILTLAMTFMCSAGVLAAEVASDGEAILIDSNITQTEENISFDYKDNRFTITKDPADFPEGQLTVLLLKGDYVSQTPVLSDDSVYYIGQKEGSSYASVFQNMGVKMGLTPGEYTLIASGTDGIKIRNKVVIGSTVANYLPPGLAGCIYGNVEQSIRVYDNTNASKYVYVCVAKMNVSGNLSDLGFVVQRKNGNIIQKANVTSDMINFNSSLKNIAGIDTSIQIGFQINDIASEYEVVAIPYMKTNN